MAPWDLQHVVRTEQNFTPYRVDVKAVDLSPGTVRQLDFPSGVVNLVAGLAFGLFGVYAVIRETTADGFNLHILMVAVAAAVALLIAGLGFVELRPSPVRRSRNVRTPGPGA